MKKLVVEETYPRSEIAKNMIYNKMKSHYRRLSSAKPKVDTNLPKPPKNSLPLSREISEIVDRNYHCYKHLPKHRCLKELENSDFQFKPLILSTSTESKLKSLINVYHPPVRTPRKTKTRESNRVKLEEPNQTVNEGINLAEVDDSNDTKEPEEQKTIIENIPVVSKKEMFVQTDHIPKHRMKQPSTYRPIDIKALHFLRDITDEVLRKGVYTDASLEAVFNHHVTLNTHNLDMETMENELDKLRDEVGMPRPGLRNSIHSDEEALDALESLHLDPTFKQEIINSLRLHNTENYHNTIIESQISIESLSSSKHLEIVEKPNLLEKPQAARLKEQFLPGNLAIENQGEEEEVEEDIGEMTSTTSEVSDIQEIEFEDIKKIIDDIEEENQEDEENHSVAVKTITQSLSAVNSKIVSYEGNSEVNKSIQDTNSEMLSHSENNKNKEKSIISEVEERDNKDEEESIMDLKILKIEGISQEKEDDIKTITKNTDDHSSVKTDIKTELHSEITDEEVGAEDTAEEEEVVDDEDDLDKFETEEKSSRTNELVQSDSSSDMSSIKTEDSDN